MVSNTGYTLKNFPLLRDFFAELLGTFILMVFGIGSVAQAVLSRNTLGSSLSIHWSWGFGVALGVSASAGVTGGHLNPAVSLAMVSLGRLPLRKLPVYALGQYVGSFLAAVVCYLVYMDALSNYDGGLRQVTGPNATAGIWSTYPQDYVSTWTGLGDQIFGTAILLICVLALTDSHHFGPGSALTPFCVGAVVVAIGMTFGLNCGYALNPARDLAPRIFTTMAGWGVGPLSYRSYSWFWVPIVGPHLGALLGAHLYQFLVGLHWPDPDDVIGDIAPCPKNAEQGIPHEGVELHDPNNKL